MTIKEKAVEAWNKIDSKFNIRRLKFHYLAVVLILFALPLTVILAKNQTSDSTHAQGKAVLYDQTSNENYIIPAVSAEQDGETYIAPNDLASAQAVKKNDLSVDQQVISSTASIQAVGVTKPNIIFVLFDDTAYLDDRIYSRLPTIKDMFIDHGVRFTRFYGESPLCCPGRAGYLTGQHTSNHNVVTNDVNLFNPTETIATELKKAGYYTFLSGKYFNGFRGPNKNPTPGWDNFSGFGGAYYNYYLWNNGKRVFYDNEYSTNVIANKAVVYLKKAPANKPIFAYITPYAVHEYGSGSRLPAIDSKYEGDSRCKDIPSWKNANYNEADLSDKPGFVQGGRLNQPDGWNLTKPCEAFLSVDDLVGKVKNELKAQGRLENTIFVFGADNGMDWGAHGHYGKVWPYAGQVNFFVYWPKVLGNSPYTISEVVQNIDVAPTFCEIAGCKMGPYPNGQKKADGKSFLSILKKQTTTMGRDVVLEAMKGDSKTAGMPTYNAVYSTSLNSDGLWHYVEYSSGEKELYDLSNGPCSEWSVGMSGDPCEMNNLLKPGVAVGSAYLDIADRLSDRLKLLKVQKGNPIPTAVVTPTLVITPTP